MLIEYIERLRKESPGARRRAVATWTAVIVVGIVALYITYIGLNLTVLAPTPTGARDSTIAAPYESAQ